MPAPIFESLAINQTPHSTSHVETRAAIKWRQAKDEQDFKLAIQEAFDKEQQAQIQHELQEIEWYLHELMNPQFTSDLTNSEKETIVQDILTYLWSHQEVPADLIMDIQQKFTESNNQPTPPAQTWQFQH